MKAGPFFQVIADAYRADEATVRVYGRTLREAGLLTTGARGINAPHMLPLDAARMTIAMLATDSPLRSPDRVRRFGAMPLDRDRSRGDLPAVLFGGDGVTLETALTRLFAAQPDPFDEDPYVEILENAKTARIEMTGGAEAVFRDAHRPEDVRDADASELFGIRRARGLATIELMRVALAMLTDPTGYPEIVAAHDYLRSDGAKDAETWAAMQARIAEFHDHPERRRPDWFKGA